MVLNRTKICTASDFYVRYWYRFAYWEGAHVDQNEKACGCTSVLHYGKKKSKIFTLCHTCSLLIGIVGFDIWLRLGWVFWPKGCWNKQFIAAELNSWFESKK